MDQSLQGHDEDPASGVVREVLSDHLNEIVRRGFVNLTVHGEMDPGILDETATSVSPQR